MFGEFGRVCSFHTLDVVIEKFGGGICPIGICFIWRCLVFKVIIKGVGKDVE